MKSGHFVEAVIHRFEIYMSLTGETRSDNPVMGSKLQIDDGRKKKTLREGLSFENNSKTFSNYTKREYQAQLRLFLKKCDMPVVFDSSNGKFFFMPHKVRAQMEIPFEQWAKL